MAPGMPSSVAPATADVIAQQSQVIFLMFIRHKLILKKIVQNYMKQMFFQDYVDENLLAFQAQITQLQGKSWS